MGALMGAFHAAGNVSTGKSPEVFLHLAHAASNSCAFASAPLILPLLTSTNSRMVFTRDHLLTSQSLGSSSGTTITQEIRDDRRKSWFKREPKFTQIAEQGQVA